MMKYNKLLLFILLSVITVFTAGKGLEPESVVAGNTAFALDLYSQLKEQKGNIFFSPYSISSALAMAYAGARGLTAAEMAKTLHFQTGDDIHADFARLDSTFDDIDKNSTIQLRIANSLWPQKDYPILTDYLEFTKRYYGVSIKPVDYVKAPGEAAKLINTWVEVQTNYKIRDLILSGSLDPTTVMLLVNAIYFKGDWDSKFDSTLTVEADFFKPGRETTPVAMMNQEGIFGYSEIEGAKLLELPYEGRELSMVIILPDTPDGLSAIEDRLSQQNLETWLGGIAQKTVDVDLPRFKFTWGMHDITKQMMALGMHRAFDGGADFSGIDGSNSLFIKAIFHKAFIEVNEEGSEAAAATGVFIATSMQKIKSFKADHPFFFLIRDIQSGSVLFLGRILDPNQSTE